MGQPLLYVHRVLFARAPNIPAQVGRVKIPTVRTLTSFPSRRSRVFDLAY